MDYISKSNTRNNNADITITDIILSIATTFIAIFTMILAIVTHFLFFKQFEKHYKQLNVTVFRPLFDIRSKEVV